MVFPVIRVFSVNLGTAFAYSCSFTSHTSYKNGMIGHGGVGGGGLNISLLFFGLSGISVVFPVIRVFPVNLGTAFAYSCSFTSHISYKNGMIGHGGWGWGGGGGERNM